MSHHSVIDTRIASGKHLVRSLQDMGFREIEDGTARLILRRLA